MKKLFIVPILALCLVFNGCGIPGLFGKNVPSGNQGQIEQQETNKTKVSGSIKGKVKLPNTPVLDKSGKPLPNQIIKIDGIETSLPQGSTGELNLDGDGDASSYTLNSLLTKWKLNSATTGLMIFGAIMIAGGCVLIYFGASAFGFAAIIAGFSLIACSVLIEKYPFVILGIVLIGVLVGIYFLYNYIRVNKLSKVKDDTMMVISKIAAEIEKLPSEIQSQIKNNLQKDDNSAIIKEVVTEAKKS